MLGSTTFEYGRNRFAAADAEAGDAVALLADLQLADQGCGKARPARADRVTDGDRAAIDIDFVNSDAKFTTGDQRHGGKSFIDLEQVDIRRASARRA